MIDLNEYDDDMPIHFLATCESQYDCLILPEKFNTSRQCVLRCLAALNAWMQEGNIGEIVLRELRLPED